MAITTDTDDSGYTSEEKSWSVAAHLAPLSGLIIPFGHLIAPLVIWLMKRNDSELVAEEAKEALNFQISFTVYMILCIPAMFIGIGAILYVIFPIVALVLMIKAAIHASKAEGWSYPFIFRLIK